MIYIGRASFRDPPLIILTFLCCVVIELFYKRSSAVNAKNLPISCANRNGACKKHLKYVGFTDTVLFPTIGNAVNVQSLAIGKPEIYRRKD